MSIKIMSFNLRYDTESDGINSFTKRFDRVLNTIRTENADIIGRKDAMYEGYVSGTVTREEYNLYLGDYLDAFKPWVEQGYEVEKRMILLSDPIKSLGHYNVEIKLMSGVIAKIVVKVESL